MMVVFFTTFVAKRAVLCTKIAINLASDTINSLFAKILILIFKQGPWIQEKQQSIHHRHQVHHDYYDIFNLF
jgi:hypothetical protein